MINFIDDRYEMSKAFINKDSGSILKVVKENINDLTYYITKNEMILGFKISTNSSLSRLYKDNFFVVKFYMINVNALHNEEQYDMFVSLLKKLNAYIRENKGYYNVRIPTHIVDIIKAYNTVFKESYFCGGTVELALCKRKEIQANNTINVFFCEKAYIELHKTELMNLAYNSFKEYQGQYHISPITENKAGEIYEKWVENCVEKYSNGSIIVAEIDNIPVGFLLLAENQEVVDLELVTVDSKYRGRGVYKSMMSYLMNYVDLSNKRFVSSTQFDNFISQSMWIDCGMKPYYSIYNFHINKLV